MTYSEIGAPSLDNGTHTRTLTDLLLVPYGVSVALIKVQVKSE